MTDDQPTTEGRTLIGPPSAHLDARCTDACYEPAVPVSSTPAEPHGIVTCSNDPTPHSLVADCVDPQPAVWTPGAGVDLLRRECPEMVPGLGVCGSRAVTEILGTPHRFTCSLLAEHEGWHRAGDGTSWAPWPPDADWRKEMAVVAGAVTFDERERAAYERGKADGYVFGHQDGWREATEGWEREWGSQWMPKLTAPVETDVAIADDEAEARRNAEEWLDHRVVSRLVGPWEPAEQPEPARCCDMHGRNCEQGGEECCGSCTEIYHFKPGHGGVPCSAPDLYPTEGNDL